ncbi:hypothetical protein LCI18_002409 [Fusarium solani-melongenae]|uniref:Uncharacterized protein n=1 Tax=Fusarium solani subsp. cucurbitae TaxID=2747967 RepID=A0ACD3YR65_FUSSC|nr:hypothetical protein LCI18_002409 [Fusarium solani-melongenae]
MGLMVCQRPTQLVPMENYQRRLEAIKRIRRRERAIIRPDWEISALQFLVLILMPLQDLEDFTNRDSPETKFVDPEEAATETSEKEQIIRRSDDARDKVLGFDSNFCLVTGMRDPDGCHIIPFTINDRPSPLAQVQLFMPAIASCFGLGREAEIGAARLPLYAGLGTSDRDFNIISLTPSLHRFCSRCYCAFKWHGLSKMPRSSHTNGARYINLDDQNDPQSNQSIIGGLSHHYGPDGNPHFSTEECANCEKTRGCSIVNVEHGHPLRSGHLFTVKRSTETIESFRQMIDLQWALIRAAAMSGAALAPELLAPELLVGPNDDDDDDDYGFPVDMLLDWRQDAQAGD